ncbi:MAG: recombination protein O N-terminal domain-containing protein [Candidatus Colwellbacteria bacterium]|nr:recombination protein O N-terminal domain-containing protein [Candidatus Colwellbacteria bacterium]
MIEYFTKAVVLDREPKGEVDATLSLYTRGLGRVYAVVKGIDRITSKLSGHFVVGNLVEARLVHKNNLQLVDGLSTRTLPSPELFKFLRFITRMTPLDEPDLELWHEVQESVSHSRFDKKTYRRALQVMGFDPMLAKCDNCGSDKIAYFHPADIMFLCSDSVWKLKIPLDELVEV